MVVVNLTRDFFKVLFSLFAKGHDHKELAYFLLGAHLGINTVHPLFLGFPIGCNKWVLTVLCEKHTSEEKKE